MTERLSPSQWRDLATFWAYWVGDARASKMMMDHAGHMEGAARREAEANIAENAAVLATIKRIADEQREGPGSAGARKHDWDCRNARPCVCLRCGATATTPRDDVEPCLAKPAPADDLVERLRENSDLDAAEGANPMVVELEREAADRIEALTKERDTIAWAHEDLINERGFMFANNKALKARVARLTHILKQVEKFKPDCDVLQAEVDHLLAEANDAG